VNVTRLSIRSFDHLERNPERILVLEEIDALAILGELENIKLESEG